MIIDCAYGEAAREERTRFMSDGREALRLARAGS